jgi:hypothetical protein
MFIYAGKVDLGFDAASAKDFQARLMPLIRETQPYAKKAAASWHLGRAVAIGRDRIPGEVSRGKSPPSVFQGHSKTSDKDSQG